MIYDYNIIRVTRNERNNILKSLNVSLEDFNEMVGILAKWIIQSNLPEEESSRKKIEIFLFNTKMNMEKTKRCLENYYTLRTEHSNFFGKMIPNTNLYNEVKKISRPIVMPDLTSDLCRIVIFRLEKCEDLQCDAEFYQLLTMMGVELRLDRGDCFYSHILIIDLSYFEPKHLLKYTPRVCSFYAKLFLAINLRLKNIHIVNPSTIIDKVLTFFKLFLPSKFHGKLVIHSSYESLYAFIPKNYLPSNYGGTQISIEKIQDRWCEEIEKNEALFEKLLLLKCQSTNNNEVSTNNVFGVNGSFRKLTVD
ncbi:uncharacterized protein LOC130440944 [Diorhabda sublineata]|uniref:uncharacterized protein LOC130440944 n=1 Tax=Diorhabda sublineata TaxID=1163346 RepID=UPI0024E07DC7|nr:uncharacterized protein LOC130440944 [Diorhabda sublineata]